MNTQQYLSTGDLAERLGVTRITLWRWSRNPALQFPAARYFGQRKFYRICEVEDWIERQPRSKGATAEQSDSAAA